jgi:hypothetical protein
MLKFSPIFSALAGVPNHDEQACRVLQGALAIPLEDRGAQGGCRVYENNVNFYTLCHKPNIQYYRKKDVATAARTPNSLDTRMI